jgi:hypothetical protein
MLLILFFIIFLYLIMARCLFGYKRLQYSVLSLCAVLAFSLSSCQNLPDPNGNSGGDVVLFNGGVISNSTANAAAFNLGLNDFLYAMMRDIYFWSDKVPPTIAPSKFSTPEDLMRALVYTPEDRFTGLTKDGQAFLAQLQQNQQTVFGFLPAQLNDTTLMVAKVIPNAPAGIAGLKRGMRILRVGGTTVNRNNYSTLTAPNTITMDVRTSDGKEQSLTMTRTTVDAKTVFRYDVLTAGGKKVAYLVYDTFLGKTDELDAAFAFFKQQGAQELVLDLRYNGGGLVSNAQYLGSLIASQLTGKVLVRQAFNTRYAANNGEAQFVTVPNAMSFQRVFVIMTRNTASASELVINALRPFMQVVLIGAPSYGKNVGSNVLYHAVSGYAVLPITFAFENALGERDFGNGFTPTRTEEDDVTRDFGDPQEKCLAAALSFIQRGVFPKQVAASVAEIPQHELLRESGDRGVLPALILPEKILAEKSVHNPSSHRP